MKNNDELIDKIIFKKYKILKKIGEGSFGLVYSGKNINNDNYVAIKFEPKNQTLLILERETYLLYYLRGLGIPEVITYGQNNKYNILIQTLLGKSIHYYFHKNNKKLSMKDCCMIGIQILDRLEYIHSKYIIHRDVKPDNFLVGNPDINIIYLIDFGFAKKYMSTRTGKHAKFAIKKKWSGTLRFASENTLRGVVQSRRDDLESLCYLLVYFMKGNLPWDNACRCQNEDIKLIYKMKKFIQPELLCNNLPQEICEFTKYCKKLNFEQKPDYNYLRHLLLNILNNQNDKNDLNFSWIVNNKNMNKSIITKYKIIHKKKNSTHQRILNALISNNNKTIKKYESFNELYLKREKNVLKKDCLTIKNISPSPELNNNLFEDKEKKEKKETKDNKEKYKNVKKKPKYKKCLHNIKQNTNLEKKNYLLKNNIISKTKTKTARNSNKKLNLLPKLENTFILNKNMKIKEKNINNIINRKKTSFINNSLMIANELNNNNIKRNLSTYNIINTKNVNNSLINFNKKKNSKFEDKKQNNLYYRNVNSFSYKVLGNNNNNSYNKMKKDKNLNYYNILNLIQNHNKEKKQIKEYQINVKNLNNNKSRNIIMNNLTHYIFQKEFNLHNSPNYSNNNTNNNLLVKKKLYNKIYQTDINKENIIRKRLKNINDNIKFISYKNSLKKPQKNIKIIKLMSPIKGIANFYKFKKNSIILKEKFKKIGNIKSSNSITERNYIINNYNDKSDNFPKYYNYTSLNDKYKNKEIKIPKNKKIFLNKSQFINKDNLKILKTNSWFKNNKLIIYKRNNINNISLNNPYSSLFEYISPKSIEKFKNK